MVWPTLVYEWHHFWTLPKDSNSKRGILDLRITSIWRAYSKLETVVCEENTRTSRYFSI